MLSVVLLGRKLEMLLACTLAIRVCWIMKYMNNVIFGGNIVRRGVNPLTRVLEYSIKEFWSGVQVSAQVRPYGSDS